MQRGESWLADWSSIGDTTRDKSRSETFVGCGPKVNAQQQTDEGETGDSRDRKVERRGTREQGEEGARSQELGGIITRL